MAAEEEDEVIIPGVDDLPLFASEEARDLDRDIKHKEHVIEDIDEQLDDNQARLRIMQEHKKNVQQEVDHTNALLEARNRETETETHMYQLTKRELGRLQSDNTELQQNQQELQDRLNTVQNDIFRANEKMDQFKLQMNCSQEELEQWAVAAKQKEEDNLALQKYTRVDEVKIKERNLTIEKLTAQLLAKKAELENELTDTQARQVELDRIADEFRVLHGERQKLVEQWQETIVAMKRRDAEINEVGEKYAAVKQRVAEQEEVLRDNRARLKMQVEENEEVERQGEMLARLVAKKREELVVSKQRLVEFKDELEAIKSELTSSANQVLKKRQENQNMAREVEKHQLMLEDARESYRNEKRRLEAERDSTVGVEQDAKAVEEALGRREQDRREVIRAMEKKKQERFQIGQRLHELRSQETTIIADISGTKAAISNLQAKLHQLDAEAMRQQELIYNAEFQIQQVERKVARVQGERTDDEKKVLNAKIAELEGELTGLKETRKMLTTQKRKLDNEVRAERRRFADAQKHQQELRTSIAEQELASESCEQELRIQRREKEESMVQNDLLKLEVKKLMDVLNAGADEVFNLENRREQLEMSMEERRHEVQVHKDVLTAQLRAANEEKHTAAMDLAQRKLQVDNLRRKFESMATVSGGGDGESKSQAYYIIQAAQNKEELQRKGDNLDQDIRKCEREVRGLRTTLEHLEARNSAFRDSFQRANVGSDEAQALKQLAEQKRLARDALFRKKKELQRLQTDLDEDERRLQQITEQVAKVQQQSQHLGVATAEVQDELSQQDDVLRKLNERIAQSVEQHRQAAAAAEGGDATSATLQEQVFRAETLRDTTDTVLYTLGQLSREFPEMKEVLDSSLEECGLRIPQRPPSRAATAGAGAAAGQPGDEQAAPEAWG